MPRATVAQRAPDPVAIAAKAAKNATPLPRSAVFRRLAERGLLRLDDPLLAANHFASLVLGMPLDRGDAPR